METKTSLECEECGIIALQPCAHPKFCKHGKRLDAACKFCARCHHGKPLDASCERCGRQTWVFCPHDFAAWRARTCECFPKKPQAIGEENRENSQTCGVCIGCVSLSCDCIKTEQNREDSRENAPHSVSNRYASVILTGIRSFCQLLVRLNRSFWHDVWFSDDEINQIDRPSVSKPYRRIH